MEPGSRRPGTARELTRRAGRGYLARPSGPGRFPERTKFRQMRFRGISFLPAAPAFRRRRPDPAGSGPRGPDCSCNAGNSVLLRPGTLADCRAGRDERAGHASRKTRPRPSGLCPDGSMDTTRRERGQLAAASFRRQGDRSCPGMQHGDREDGRRPRRPAGGGLTGRRGRRTRPWSGGGPIRTGSGAARLPSACTAGGRLDRIAVLGNRTGSFHLGGVAGAGRSRSCAARAGTLSRTGILPHVMDAEAFGLPTARAALPSHPTHLRCRMCPVATCRVIRRLSRPDGDRMFLDRVYSPENREQPVEITSHFCRGSLENRDRFSREPSPSARNSCDLGAQAIG